MEHGAFQDQQWEEMKQMISVLQNDNSQLKEQLITSTEMIELTCETMKTWQEKSRGEQGILMQYFLEARKTIATLKQKITDRDEQLAKIGINMNSSPTKSQHRCAEENHISTTENVNCNMHPTQSTNEFDEKQVSLEEGDHHSIYCQQQQNNEYEEIEPLNKTIASLKSDLLHERNDKQQLSDSLQYLREKFDELLNECEYVYAKESQTESTVKGLKKEVDSLTERLSPADLVMRDDLISRVSQLESQVDVMRAQAEIYRKNVESERKSRESINVERLKLQSEVDYLNGLLKKYSIQQSCTGIRPYPSDNTHYDITRKESTPGRTLSK